jgi:GH43 family beta-xylosidase
LTAPLQSNLLNLSSWKKHSHPVFTASAENRVYAPGHNSFFRSPDGTEDWILYHANDNPGEGCGSLRSPRAQPFTWTSDGLPDFGHPISTSVKLAEPSNSQ